MTKNVRNPFQRVDRLIATFRPAANLENSAVKSVELWRSGFDLYDAWDSHDQPLGEVKVPRFKIKTHFTDGSDYAAGTEETICSGTHMAMAVLSQHDVEIPDDFRIEIPN